MIDGIKAILTDNLEEIRNNPLLDFEIPAKISVQTGELKNQDFPVAKYKGLFLIDKGSCIVVKGSIHVMNNDGKHNYNKFGLSEIHLALYEMANNLKIVTNFAKLKNIEFGVNLLIDYEPRLFLNSLIFHKGKGFTFQTGRNMQFRECSHSQFYIKVYDKGLQNGLNQFILRFELKFIKMEKINGFGIKYLSDLLNPQNLKKLRTELLRIYNEILIGDLSVVPEKLLEKDKILFANGHNGNYWDTRLPRTKNFEGGETSKIYRRKIRAYSREMNKFKDILNETGADNRKILIRELIESESDNLISKTINILDQSPKCLELTVSETLGATQEMSRIDQVEDLITVEDKEKELSRNDTLLYSGKNTHTDNSSINECIVTELDISMQKPGSRFLCTDGIKFYKENNPEIWLMLWKRLSSNWHGCVEEVQIQEIHHSIRNEYFNKIHNTRRSINKIMNDPALFNQLYLIHPDKLEIAGLTCKTL